MNGGLKRMREEADTAYFKVGLQYRRDLENPWNASVRIADLLDTTQYEEGESHTK
jgi:hypothetical protein